MDNGTNQVSRETAVAYGLPAAIVGGITTGLVSNKITNDPILSGMFACISTVLGLALFPPLIIESKNIASTCRETVDSCRSYAQNLLNERSEAAPVQRL